MIKVVGLGFDKDQITLAGVNAIKSAKNVYIKTALTPTYKFFEENNINVVSFDSIFENADNFEDLDEKIIEILLKDKNACLCVNGSGYDDRCVIKLKEKTKIEIYPTVALGNRYIEPNVFNTSISAYELKETIGFNYDTNGTLVIYDVDNKYVASDIKLILSNLIGDDQEVLFNNKVISVTDIDRQKTYNWATTIIVKPIELIKKKRFTFDDLYRIMKILRSDNGCEWDKAQTHETIRENIIEEAYELVEAINNEDVENMIEESGDLMLQAIFHCVIGEDMGEYNAQDALSGLCSKLIFRHPHVFGEIKVNNAQEALSAWEGAKAKEKHYTKPSSKMDSIPKTFPSLMRATKTLSAAKKAGITIDIRDVKEMLNKAVLELLNVEDEEVAGKVLMLIVLLLKLYDINPEVALDEYTNKFVSNFKDIEDNLQNKDIKQII